MVGFTTGTGKKVEVSAEAQARALVAPLVTGGGSSVVSAPRAAAARGAGAARRTAPPAAAGAAAAAPARRAGHDQGAGGCGPRRR